MDQPQGLHPIAAATVAMRAALTSVAGVEPVFASAQDRAGMLVELSRLEARLGELKLRVLAASEDVAAAAGARDAGDWLAHAARSRPEEARRQLRLATALDQRYPAVRAALREGEATLAQAHVIAQLLDTLPAEIPAEVIARAEGALVAHARSFGPRELARLGRRVVHLVAPEVAEEAEARHLAALERAAHRKTRLTLRRCGDGTTRLSGLLPDAAATRLATYLHAYTSPRQPDQRRQHGAEGRDEATRCGTPVWAYPRKLGEAFCQLLEHLDPARLPLHGGDATTLIVTMTLADLRRDLAKADLLGGTDLPGDAWASGGEAITAATARRLACTARIIPAVLGGDSQLLDLGRSQRLFTPAQRKALLLRDRSCRAEGCTIPGTWCEAHHRNPWHRGGRTDQDNAVLLCARHHHQAHDPGYRHEHLPTGDLRYHRRS